MPEDKDRYGDKLRDAERGREDEYFAKRDRELAEKMRHQAGATTGPDAHGRCPKCGQHLAEVKHLGVTVDECPAGHGMWLNKGELEHLAQRDSNGWLARFLGRPR